MRAATIILALALCSCAASPPEPRRTQPRIGELVWITLADGSGFDATYEGRTAGEIVVRQRETLSSKELRLPMAQVKKITSLRPQRFDNWPPAADPVSPFAVNPYGQ